MESSRRLSDQLDVTLQNAHLLNDWLAGWVLGSAESPGSYSAAIVEQDDRGYVIELRGKDNRATGGIVFVGSGVALHVLPAFEHQSEHLKARSLGELTTSSRIVLKRRCYERRCVAFAEGCLYGLLPLLLLITLGYLLRLGCRRTAQAMIICNAKGRLVWLRRRLQT